MAKPQPHRKRRLAAVASEQTESKAVGPVDSAPSSCCSVVFWKESPKGRFEGKAFQCLGTRKARLAPRPVFPPRLARPQGHVAPSALLSAHQGPANLLGADTFSAGCSYELIDGTIGPANCGQIQPTPCFCKACKLGTLFALSNG